MITIIDYGMGNLRSVQKAFEATGVSAQLSSDPDIIIKADKLVIPGVGAFGDAMANLQSMNLVDPIKEKVASGTPFMGICLGLQLLFTTGEEKGVHKGLGIIPGKVVHFPQGEKVPHIGWNQVTFKQSSPLMHGIKENEFFYFVHSYYVQPDDTSAILAETEYGVTFTSMIAQDNVFGIQCHPEKSQEAGLQVLKNFTRI